MKNIILIAPPAAGKGTLSTDLVDNYGYEHISTGDMLRTEINSGSLLGQSVKNIMEQGLLVSDEIIIQLINNKMNNLSGKPFIFDGFPRTLIQAKQLNNIFKNYNIDNYVAIYLDIDEQSALQRSLGRIVCKNCGRSYNIYNESLKPKNDNVCDSCGELLEKRTDDNEESFRVRFKTFVNNTKPICEYYDKLNKLYIINAATDSNIVYSNVMEIVND